MSNNVFFRCLIFCFSIILVQCTPTREVHKEIKEDTETTKETYRIGFYNVENLFDTINSPLRNDDEFLPKTKKNWNTERYQKKLNDLAKIISAMGTPTILGLSEVENRAVCRDLADTDALRDAGYITVHQQSPDFRGIDVALLFQKDKFRLITSDLVRIDFPANIVEDYTTRDILYVHGILDGKTELHIFVNHWPSRYGGVKASEPKRVYVAQQLKKYADKILAKNPDANIISMGDFNDETDNKSVAVELGDSFHNCMAALDKAGKGTYNYRGNWNMLDHILVSKSLQTGESGLRASEGTVFREEWMMFQSKKNGATPNRTYGGPNYYGGFSDHLPVYVDLH